ncbi:MAG: TetR/AcrR family transcriptional regulator [Caulobacteraceae bacterium]|nr:TetR/AcrR family transcriptional regulator [Caulobacteraceae bacterium]
MRVRTEVRRRAIVATAWEVFRDKGYERTTMSDISERLGGSKATLYGYYQSKEQLFAAALEAVIGAMAERTFAPLSAPGEFEARLSRFADAYLQQRLDTDSIAIERALVAEGERSEVGERLRQQFVQPHWRLFASHLDQAMQAGRLRRADPMNATWHFRGLVESDLLERRLHGDRTITAHEVQRAARTGVEAFLRAYAPEAAIERPRGPATPVPSSLAG